MTRTGAPTFRSQSSPRGYDRDPVQGNRQSLSSESVAPKTTVSKPEVQAVTRRIADEAWGRTMAQHSEYGVLRGWQDLTSGIVNPVQLAREFLIDSFGDIVDSVAAELALTKTVVASVVALVLCPPTDLHGLRETDESSILLQVAEVATHIRDSLQRAADRGSLRPRVADQLARRAELDALAAVALGLRVSPIPMVSDLTPYRPNALLVAAVYIEDVSRWACSQLNKMLYGQLAPAGEDPFATHLGEGFGLEIAYSLALGGCAGTHDDPECTRRRHDIRLWDPSLPDEPPSLPYWLFNLLVGARGVVPSNVSVRYSPENELPSHGVKLQAGALRESVLPYRLNVAVLKSLVLRCRECDRKLDGVSLVCLGKLHATNEQCDLFPQFDNKRLLLNPVRATPAPVRCQICSGAVEATGLGCPGCGHLVSRGRRSSKTYLPGGVMHPRLRAFVQNASGYESEDAVVDSLCRWLRRGNSTEVDSIRLVHLVADELDLDTEIVIDIAERHVALLRECAAGGGW